MPLYVMYIMLISFIISVSKKDPNYEATKLHFENLTKRYGNPIIILNLIKVCQLCFDLFVCFVVKYLHTHASKQSVSSILSSSCACFDGCDKQTREKRPRESILRTEFRNAINLINKDLSEENHLRFLHLDLNKFSRRYIRSPSDFPFKL